MAFQALSMEALMTGHLEETESQRKKAIADAVKLSDAEAAKLPPVERDTVEFRKKQSQLDRLKKNTAYLQEKVKTMNKRGLDDRARLGDELIANVSGVQNFEASLEARAWTDDGFKALLVHELQEIKLHGKEIFEMAQKETYPRSPDASPGYETGYK